MSRVPAMAVFTSFPVYFKLLKFRMISPHDWFIID
jgi:hypothetical protein